MLNLLHKGYHRHALEVSTASSQQTVESSQRSNVLCDNYTFGRLLGKGACGRVLEVQCRETGSLFACKIITKQSYQQMKKKSEEIRMLATLAHPNIVKLHEYFETRSEVHILMPLVEAGELYSVLKKHGEFSERKALTVISALLDAVSYLHAKNITHRDIKLENVLLEEGYTNMKKENVKLIDFGFAKELKSPEYRTKSRVGTQFYVAPEILLKRSYGVEVDMWSLGVVAFMILSNTRPFYEQGPYDIQYAITNATYSFDGNVWKNVSYDAKDFLRRCFTLRQDARLNVREALVHPWVLRRT